MLKFYHAYIATYHNNTKIGTTYGKMLTDEIVQEETHNLTWDNLEEFYSNNGLKCKFNIWNFKKGRRVSFFSDKLFPHGDYADIKEWKKQPLNITVTITYKEYTPSVNEVLDWSNGEKAIQYLIEKGLDIAPKA